MFQNYMKKLFLFKITYFISIMVIRLSLTSVVLFISSGSLIWSQTLTNARVIKWSDSLRTFSLPSQKLIKSPTFQGAAYDPASNLLPIYFEKIRLDNISYQLPVISYQLKNPVFQLMKTSEVLKTSEVYNEIKINQTIAYRRKHPYAVISFVPIRYNTTAAAYEKLVSFELEVATATPRIEQMLSPVGIKKTSKTNFASNSVLSSGKWYKIGVSKNGVYKIDKDFLADLGINVNSIDPRNIRIYGNGGGMLPELNSTFRYDDLIENAIEVVGEADGSLDKDDHIIFYGQGPDQWYLDTAANRFYHKKHLYSGYTYYFITADLGPGKRITTQLSLGASTDMVNSFDDYYVYEKEEVNVIHSGREWYGELFNNVSNVKVFSINIPNIVTSSSIYMKSHVVARSTSGISDFNVSAYGINVITHSIAKVDGGYLQDYVKESYETITFNESGDNINIQYTYNKPSAEGWLDYFELHFRRELTMSGSQIAFRDLNTVGTGKVAEFILSNLSANTRIWEITNPLNVKEQQLDVNQHFILQTDSLREFIGFNSSGYLTPDAAGIVPNQDIHSLGQPNMIILTHPDFLNQANELANFHRSEDNLSVEVIKIQQCYNEFSSGAQDITAIRDMMKMFYERAGMDTAQMPKYLLLVGDGSYDYKDRVSNNTNFIPTYQNGLSYNPLQSYTSDDYYGFLDDNEGVNIGNSSHQLDIAIGRLPVKTSAEAQNVVNKIKHYASPALFGSWRNVLCFIGDDEDVNTHINDADKLATYVENNYPVYNIDKIYFDAYEQVATPGGSRYPEVNKAIDNRIFSGCLIMNYVGHGGETGWAHERVLDMGMINSWTNKDKLPLLVTATCTFSRYDNPSLVTAGEQLLLNPDGGAIALMTTVRTVFSSANYNLNINFFKKVFEPLSSGEMPTMGEVIQRAKNAANAGVNSLKFTLLGDPALKLAYPKHKIRTTVINGTPISAVPDTLKALQKVTIQGEVTDESGTKLTWFNGIVYPAIYDKAVIVNTLKNDPGSPVRNFRLQKSIIYKGKASVVSGDFSYTFIVPKDISYQNGMGRLSYYAADNTVDAAGVFDSVIIGGTSDDFAQDNIGPVINIFLNDEKFAFGGITNENPLLIVKLTDSSGINTVGNGIGHDLTAVLNEETKNTIILNDFYEAALDNYQKGEVRYPFANLEPGRYELKVKAWDVYNNSSEEYTEFVVALSEELALAHVLNYPNPFTTSTRFQFEHNRPGDMLDVQVQIYTISGKLIKTIDTEVFSQGYRVDNIEWNGRDDFGDRIGRGVYIYKLKVRTPDGKTANQFEKLVILK